MTGDAGAAGAGNKPGTDRLGDLAEWVHGLEWAAVPPDVRRAAGLHALDALGVAVRASSTDFGRRLLEGASASWPESVAAAGVVFGGPACPDGRLTALLNGTLVHGLEFDDTHVASVVHGSAVVLPAAAAAVAPDQPGKAELLRPCDLELELGARRPGQLGCQHRQKTLTKLLHQLDRELLGTPAGLVQRSDREQGATAIVVDDGLQDFRDLAQRCDPSGKFRNSFLDRYVFGTA